MPECNIWSNRRTITEQNCPELVAERVVGPRDLQVSELAHSSLRLTWSPATSDVTGYRLLVTPLDSKSRPLYFQQRQVGDTVRKLDWGWWCWCDESSSTAASITSVCSAPSPVDKLKHPLLPLPDRFESGRQHRRGDRAEPHHRLLPHRPRRLRQPCRRLGHSHYPDEWAHKVVRSSLVLAQVSSVNQPAIDFVSFQPLCLRWPTSVWSSRACSRCVWDGLSLWGSSTDSRSSSQDVRTATTWPKNSSGVFRILWPHCVLTAHRPGFTYENLLPGDTSSHVIDGLEEDREYTISIYAVFPQGPSKPVSIVGRTCKYGC